MFDVLYLFSHYMKPVTSLDLVHDLYIWCTVYTVMYERRQYVVYAHMHSAKATYI